jgi:hypothetical protein
VEPHSKDFSCAAIGFITATKSTLVRYYYSPFLPLNVQTSLSLLQYLRILSSAIVLIISIALSSGLCDLNSVKKPMSHDWSDIYLYIATQTYRRWGKNEMPADIARDSINDEQMRELKRLKEWLYSRRSQIRSSLSEVHPSGGTCAKGR